MFEPRPRALRPVPDGQARRQRSQRHDLYMAGTKALAAPSSPAAEEGYQTDLQRGAWVYLCHPVVPLAPSNERPVWQPLHYGKPTGPPPHVHLSPERDRLRTLLGPAYGPFWIDRVPAACQRRRTTLAKGRNAPGAVAASNPTYRANREATSS